MIVYRDQRSRADPRRLLLELRASTHRFRATTPPHPVARDALILAGKLEAAVADALSPEVDGTSALTRALREASVMAGRVLWHTWRTSADGAIWWDRLRHQLEAISGQCLPGEVEVVPPEGYMQYAVYPEMYLEAAERFYKETGPVEAVCIGLRSIGTSLSAVVAATLGQLGCPVESVTLRPRGHPFSREPRLTSDLESSLRCRRASYYLVIDEGPGISGSSIAGTAALLRSWGIADDHIVIFPSWETDGANLKSRVARETWSRHSQFTCSFEDVWLRSGKLQQDFPGKLRDVSAGAWRQAVYRDSAHYPAVQPQHERRKYLLAPETGAAEPRLLKFVGLGDEAARKLCRAQRLAEAGFVPPPERLAHGFLLRPFLPGSPVLPGSFDQELLESVASYLAHLCLEHPAQQSTVTSTMLQEMIEVNLSEGLGAVGPGLCHVGVEWEERIVALDGRMLAHEWIRTESGYLKTDALDHHDDHFLPGCQDIAWDLAAAAIEFRLNGPARRTLIDRYSSLSGDRSIRQRLPFYAMAYLAFRLGYCSLAADVLGNSPDGKRFQKEIGRYGGLIEQRLGCGWERCRDE
jgi:hypothetical protein